MSFSDDTYNTLKWIAQIALPALGTLYFALAQIWGLPFGEQIVGTITAIDAFLGALLKVSLLWIRVIRRRILTASLFQTIPIS